MKIRNSEMGGNIRFETGSSYRKEKAMVSRMKPMNLFRFLVVLTTGVLMVSLRTEGATH